MSHVSASRGEAPQIWPSVRRDWWTLRSFRPVSSERRMAGLGRASASLHRVFRGVDGVEEGGKRLAWFLVSLPGADE